MVGAKEGGANANFYWRQSLFCQRDARWCQRQRQWQWRKCGVTALCCFSASSIGRRHRDWPELPGLSMPNRRSLPNQKIIEAFGTQFCPTSLYSHTRTISTLQTSSAQTNE